MIVNIFNPFKVPDSPFKVTKHPQKNPVIDNMIGGKRQMKIAIVVTLFLLMIVFIIFPKFEVEPIQGEVISVTIQVDEIVQTKQISRPPPPAVPAIPIEAEDEELAEDVTIEDIDFDYASVPPPPPPPTEDEEEIPPFLPLENQPKMIGGYVSVAKHLKYPEIARKAGIQGTVYIKVLINKNGDPEQVTVLKGLSYEEMNKSAVEAIKKVKFTPATQRNKPVKFWISIPIKFQLE